MTDAPVRALLIDADNTLWDTNRVFEEARERMADVVRRDLPPGRGNESVPAGRLSEAVWETPEDTGAMVEQLARAVAFYLAEPEPVDGRIETAARRAASGTPPDALGPGAGDTICEAAEAFREALRRVPPLLEGAEDLLASVRRWTRASPSTRAALLFSEGEPDRLSVAFDAYDIGAGRYFDEIVLRTKTDRAFVEVRQQALARCGGEGTSQPADASQMVMVGDSLKRDIRPANRAGLATIYCPGAYKGNEDPDAPDEVPDAIVETVDRVVHAAQLQIG